MALSLLCKQSAELPQDHDGSQCRHPDTPEDNRNFVAALPESFVGWAEEHLKDECERYLADYRRDLAAMKRGGPK